jgi:hypothetical protein
LRHLPGRRQAAVFAEFDRRGLMAAVARSTSNEERGDVTEARRERRTVNVEPRT